MFQVVPDVYVFHHKSKSYGVERRHELTNVADTAMFERWGGVLKLAEKSLNHNTYLKEARRRITNSLSDALKCGPETLRVLFILNPIKAPEGESHKLAMHGGWISVSFCRCSRRARMPLVPFEAEHSTVLRRQVFNQALGLRMRGVCAFVATSTWTVPFFARNFPQAAKFQMFLPYSNDVQLTKYLAPVLSNYAEIFDVIIATFFTTVRPLSELVGCHPHIRPAYFVQVRGFVCVD